MVDPYHATGEDKAATFAAFSKLNLKKEWHQHIDIDKAVDFLFEKNAENTFVVDGYLVSYVVDELWHSKGRYIIELCYAKLYPGGSLESVKEFLQHEATVFGCTGVIVGTGLSDDDTRLSEKFRELGFTPYGSSHFLAT